MAYDLNRVAFIGRLGRDPHRFDGEEPVVALSVAINGGEDRTTWVSVKCFGKTAENCVQYLEKGRQVAIDGRLSSYKRDVGNGRSRDEVSIVATSVQFLGGGEERAKATPDDQMDF